MVMGIASGPARPAQISGAMPKRGAGRIDTNPGTPHPFFQSRPQSINRHAFLLDLRGDRVDHHIDRRYPRNVARSSGASPAPPSGNASAVSSTQTLLYIPSLISMSILQTSTIFTPCFQLFADIHP
jgi:hypothetical protein